MADHNCQCDEEIPGGQAFLKNPGKLAEVPFMNQLEDTLMPKKLLWMEKHSLMRG